MAKNYERPKDDYYSTPQWCITELFKIINFEKLNKEFHWKFAEPCKGDASAILKNLPENSEYADLNSGIDYLKHQWNSEPDCIITNPPFSLALEFLEKSLNEADVCIYLLRLGFLSSKKRMNFLNKNKPTNLIILSQRPSFTGKGTDNSEYAWFIFDKFNRLNLEHSIYFIKEE